METQQDQYDTPLTPFMNAPAERPRKRTFGWGDTIAVFIMAVLLGSVLYPVYRVLYPDNRTRGVVVDENFRPLPGAVLEIRDRDGKSIATATSDANGELLWNREWRIPGTTFGKFGVARFAPSTGGRARIYLAPLVLHRVQVRNAASGLPQSHLTIHANLDARTSFSSPNFHEVVGETSTSGAFTIGSLPATARMTFYSADASLAVWNVIPAVVQQKQTPYQTEIVYDVTVVPTGTISGRVVAPEGNTVCNTDVGLRLVRSALSDTEALRYRTYETGTDGKFRFTGLLPGRYEIAPNLGGRGEIRDVFVSSGQTSTITLKTSDFSWLSTLPDTR